MCTLLSIKGIHAPWIKKKKRKEKKQGRATEEAEEE